MANNWQTIQHENEQTNRRTTRKQMKNNLMKRGVFFSPVCPQNSVSPLAVAINEKKNEILFTEKNMSKKNCYDFGSCRYCAAAAQSQPQPKPREFSNANLMICLGTL